MTTQIKFVQENFSNWFKYYDNELKAMKEVRKNKKAKREKWLWAMTDVPFSQEYEYEGEIWERISQLQAATNAEKRKALLNEWPFEVGDTRGCHQLNGLSFKNKRSCLPLYASEGERMERTENNIH